MTLSTRLALAAMLAATFGVGHSAHALTVAEVFTEAEAAGGVPSPFLNTVTTSGGVAYAVVGGGGAADVGAVVAFDGSSFTVVSDTAQWLATGSTNDIFASEGAGVVGNSLRFAHSLDNAIYEVDLTTGVASTLVPKTALDALFGSSANLSSRFEVAADGTIYGINGPTDTLYAVSPAGVASIEIADLNATIGGDSIQGIGISGSTVYISDNDTDSIWAWDTVADTASVVLDSVDIDPLTSDIDGVAAFGDLFAAPDGLVYFYEADGDDLLSFDPADPAGSLSVVVSTAEFDAGPSSDTINQLSWWDGSIAFTDGSLGFYNVVPEPASALLGALALVGLAARRR